MLNEASAPTESSLALTTLIRNGSLDIPLLARHLPRAKPLPNLSLLRILDMSIAVDPLVSQEMGIPPKGFATHAALVRLLPGVDSVMLEEAAALAKGLPTVLTLVGLLPSVRSLVLDKV